VIKKNFYTVIFLSLLFLLFYYLVCIANPNKDFDIFIGASKLIFEGKTCYNVWLHSGSSGLKYFYSPLFAVLIFPLTYVSQTGYNSVWFVLNLFFLWRIFILISIFFPLDLFNQNTKKLFYTLILLSVGRFLYDNLQLGQMTIFLLYSTLESLNFIRTKQTLKGAAILALIINIKIIPIAILVLLIYKAEFKAVLFTLLFLVIYLFLPMLFIGNDFNLILLKDWWISLSGTNHKSIIEDYGRPSLSAFIPSLLMDTPVQFNIKRNILQLNEEAVGVILNVIRVLFLLLMAFLLGKPFQKFKNNIEVFYSISLVCLFTPLIFPHQGKYSFFYLLPAYAFILFKLLHSDERLPNSKNKISWVLLVISFVLLTLSTDGLIGRRLSDLCEYLNFITIGTFALFGSMCFVKSNEKLEY